MAHGLWFRVMVSAFGFRVKVMLCGFGFTVQGLEGSGLAVCNRFAVCNRCGFDCRIQGLGCKVLSSGVRFWGSSFMVLEGHGSDSGIRFTGQRMGFQVYG